MSVISYAPGYNWNHLAFKLSTEHQNLIKTTNWRISLLIKSNRIIIYDSLVRMRPSFHLGVIYPLITSEANEFI